MGQVYTYTEALGKAMKYCAYQERSHFEVREKLRSLGVDSDIIEEVIVALIEQDFLNEERFARAYSRGKFRIKHWGRNKIAGMLRSKGVSDHCIRLGLSEIDEAVYRDTLEDLAAKALEKYKAKTRAYEKKAAQYLIGRGYEPSLVWEIINKTEP